MGGPLSFLPQALAAGHLSAGYRSIWADFFLEIREVPYLLVPGERIELPTNGLQNRCSTAELTRLGPIYRVFW